MKRRLTRMVPAIVVLVSVVAVVSNARPAGRRKLSARLEERIRRTSGTLRVIVKTRATPTSDQLARVYENDGEVLQAYDHVGGFAAKLPAQRVGALALDPNVDTVSTDEIVTGSMAWTVSATATDVAWEAYDVRGNGVGIAVLDTGVNPNKDLSRRIAASKELVRASRSVTDDHGHGTHVAGIAAGDGRASKDGGYHVKFVGIAPKARVISVKVLDHRAQGYVSDVIAGIDWCIANRGRLNLRVLNLSLGHPPVESYTTDPLCRAVERAWKAGLVVVVSAGNRGRVDPMNPASGVAYGTVDSPGNSPYVITVGATNTRSTGSPIDDVMATYSSHGPTLFDHFLKPDLVAPGNRVVSLAAPASWLDRSYPQNRVNPKSFGGGGSVHYYTLSGTSMAAATVSGAAALLVQRNPTISPDTVKARLMASADKQVFNSDGSAASIFIRGAGLLNVDDALGHSGTLRQYALSPVVIRKPIMGLFQLLSLSGSNILWGEESLTDNVLWGNNVLWGEEQLGQNVLWAENILWSDEGVWSGNVLWSEDPVIGELQTVTGDDR